MVHGGKCTEFEGDLQDYAKWLREARQQQINAQTAVAQNNSSSAAQLPLKSIKKHSVKKQLAVVNKLDQSVKILKRLNLKLKSFSHVLLKSKKLLADPSLYEANRKEDLLKLMNEQTELKAKLEQYEEQLLELMMELEEMEAPFEN